MRDATVATELAPDHLSEEYHLITAGWAPALGGASRDSTSDIRRHHDVPWFAACLGMLPEAAIATEWRADRWRDRSSA